MTKSNVTIAIVVLILGGLGMWFFTRSQNSPVTPSQQVPSVESSAPQASDSAKMGEIREIKVLGSEFSFSPFSISVKSGEKVRIIFQNAGKFPHNLAIDKLGVATKTISTGETDTVEFSTDQKGSFAMYCSVDSHRQKGMEGVIQVE